MQCPEPPTAVPARQPCLCPLHCLGHAWIIVMGFGPRRWTAISCHPSMDDNVVGQAICRVGSGPRQPGNLLQVIFQSPTSLRPYVFTQLYTVYNQMQRAYRTHRRMQATGAARPNKARCTARLLVRALVLGPKKHLGIWLRLSVRC